MRSTTGSVDSGNAAKCVYDSRMFKAGNPDSNSSSRADSSGNPGGKRANADTRTEEDYFKRMQSWSEKKVGFI